jgi:hypothetical protein
VGSDVWQELAAVRRPVREKSPHPSREVDKWARRFWCEVDGASGEAARFEELDIECDGIAQSVADVRW